MHSQLVVLGGGPGGYAAAFLAADKGMEVTLVDAEPRLGGTCLLRGCIPSKALLHVARVVAETHEMKEWGIEFGSMKLDVAALRARKEKIIATLSGGLKQLAKQRKVRVIHARGTFLNSGTIILEPRPDGDRPDDLQLTYDHCILATGSRPTKIPALDLPSDRVMDSTEALELADVPPSLLVVGGGYIGLEMATV
jgi:dihydrolipoamide dehydrogenase